MVGLHGDLEWQSTFQPDLNPDWVYGATMSIIGAGVETTGIQLSALLYYVSTSEECRARIDQELQKAYNAGQLDEIPAYDQVSKLPYLQACIKEAQRIQPAVGMSLVRTTPKGGVSIDGHHIPAGVVVGMNPYTIHRCQEVIGDDCDIFRPSRYLESTSAQKKRIDSVSLAFGGESRSCPGKHLAWVLLLKTCATILLHFDLEILDATQAKALGSTFREQCFFYVKWEGVWVRMKPRIHAKPEPESKLG